MIYCLFRPNVLNLKVIAYSSVGGGEIGYTKMLTHNRAQPWLNPKNSNYDLVQNKFYHREWVVKKAKLQAARHCHQQWLEMAAGVLG